MDLFKLIIYIYYWRILQRIDGKQNVQGEQVDPLSLCHRGTSPLGGVLTCPEGHSYSPPNYI